MPIANRANGLVARSADERIAAFPTGVAETEYGEWGLLSATGQPAWWRPDFGAIRRQVLITCAHAARLSVSLLGKQGLSRAPFQENGGVYAGLRFSRAVCTSSDSRGI